MITQEVMQPLASGWYHSLESTRNLFQHYIALSDAAIENERLKTEVLELKSRLLDYDEQVRQIDRLRKLLGFTEKYERKLLVAEVVGGRRQNPFKSLRINRGLNDGIRIGMPVVAAEGILGRVVRVGQNIADVQLLVDFDFNLDVLLQRTRIRGVLKGHQGESCRLYLQRGTETRIGDTIITSGIVGGFPKGLPVGKVIRISYESDNVSQIITVEPWVDYRRLEEVIVLFETDPDLQKIIETAGQDWVEKTVDSVSGG